MRGLMTEEKSSLVKLMNQLYDHLEDYINFFLPSMKCVKKEKQGKKYCRVYDTAQTAHQRVLTHPKIPDQGKAELKAKYAKLNPRILREQIDQLIKKILT